MKRLVQIVMLTALVFTLIAPTIAGGSIQYTTPTFTRVGATCAQAQQDAIAAAIAAAVCNSGETPCGSVSYHVGNCTLNHLNQFQASAFATYGCGCACVQYTTPTFTRVGATCAQAQQDAIAAAIAAAVCNSGETTCGGVSYRVGNCTLNHLNQFQASAFATYGCATGCQ